ncbi:hypothetical protein CD138_12650 [Staphylococcus intermedius NCTC 11048]|nr:hypothetical protein CD138_12650 [Staphylococcus intermedius NCTC 11048]
MFISEIVHIECSFLLKLYYIFNFATEPFSEAKRKEATQKCNIIKPFILGNQSLSSISKNLEYY